MNNNYMKTILSGVKEWTENLTDDAIDKANNAIDKANNALDKALFVVKITTTDGKTFSADKTFDEIVQAYNEGKYSIVANFMGVYIMPPLAIISDHAAMFGAALKDGGRSVVSVIIAIAPNNSIQMIQTPLATENSKLPNPYPLTFTGAVSETYDGSSAKTIKIPIGADGITPTIGENGNWYLGDTDTNKPSRGEKGEKGETGAQGEKGDTGATGADGKSAYSYAVDGGYIGTEAEFAAKLAAEKLPNPYPLTFTGAVSGSYDGSSAKTIEIPSGGAHEGIYSLLVEHTITEDVSEVVYTNDEYPGIANLKHILVSIIFPEKQTTGWWKLLAGDAAIMSTVGVSNVKHYYGAADVKCGHWIWSGAGSNNDSAGQKLSPPSVEFNPRIGFIPTVYNDYSSLRIYGNSFTLTAGTVVRIWGCD